VRTPKLKLAVKPSTGGHWNPPKKKTPHDQSIGVSALASILPMNIQD